MTLPIPTAALDDRLAFVGNTGSGKTYSAGTAIERLLSSGARAVIPDPLGVWWGLALADDGKTPSTYRKREQLVIFGGDRGDLPLTEHAGALIGETVAGMKESCILDMSGIGTKAAERRFMLAFLTALYKHKTVDPLHVVFDEADMWAPQRVLDKEGEAMKLLGMMETVCRRGRVRGFIPWLITQRPAVVSKNVLSQVDGLVAFKLTSVQDRDAIGDWVEGQADKAQWKAMWADMATLERGRGMVWIPGRGILKTSQFPTKATFDSSRTPGRGERLLTAGALQPVNLDKLKDRLAKVEQESKASDPKALRGEIARLQRELTYKSTSAPTAASVKAAEDAGYASGYGAGIQVGWSQALEKVGTQIRLMTHQMENMREAALALGPLLSQKRPTMTEVPRPAPTIPRVLPAVAPQAVSRASRTAPIGDGSISGVGQRILNACSEMEAICRNAPPRTLVAIMCGYENVKSTGFAKALSGLSASGLVVYPTSGTVRLTDEGRALAAPVDRPSSAQEVQSRVIDVLGPTAGKILSTLIENYPSPVLRSDVAARAGYENVKSTGFAKALSRLSALGFVDYPSAGEARANEILFPVGMAA